MFNLKACTHLRMKSKLCYLCLELMQLLYLLSRDPAIPKDARYHVTLAQSEIALLTRQMQNATGDQAENTVVER